MITLKTNSNGELTRTSLNILKEEGLIIQIQKTLLYTLEEGGASSIGTTKNGKLSESLFNAIEKLVNQGYEIEVI